MNIAAIKCSAGLNLGNNFINAGGSAVLSQIHPTDNIEYFEFYDSCLPQWQSGEILTPSTIEHIKNTHDLIYVFAGSAGGDTMYEHFFKPLNDIGVPFIPIGIGCEGNYNQNEQIAINKIRDLSNCVKLVTRDPKTYEFIENKEGVLSGIDMAFFAKDYYGDVKQNSEFRYAIINYEPYGSLVVDVAYQLYNQIVNDFDKVYFIENTVSASRKDIKNYIQIGYDEDLWRFYANASLVISTRIHSCVCSLSNEVDFIYLGSHDVGGQKGRNTLFNSVGLTLNLNEVYSSKEHQGHLNEVKKDYINRLKGFLT